MREEPLHVTDLSKRCYRSFLNRGELDGRKNRFQVTLKPSDTSSDIRQIMCIWVVEGWAVDRLALPDWNLKSSKKWDTLVFTYVNIKP